MKRYSKYILVVTLLFMSSLSPAQTSVSSALTLKDVIRLTMDNHPLIKQKEDELRAAQFRVEQQKSFYLPNVSAGASYTRIGPIPAFNFGGQNLELAPANNYNIGVFVHHTLYDFGKRDLQVEYTSSFLNSLKDNEELVKNDLTNQAIRTFYAILFLDNSIDIKNTQYSTLEEHLNITELRIKNGTATDYDVLSTKTRMIEIKNEKADLLSEKTKQQMFLKELTGINRNNDLQISGLFNLPESKFDTDLLLAAAYKNRPELKLANDALNTANIQKNMISQLDKPVLSADVGYGLKNGYEPNINVMRGNWFASVSVGIPIFNGNLTDKKVSEASVSIDAGESKIRQVKESIATDVYQAKVDLENNLTRINSTLEQIDYADKSLERAKLQYERGAGTNLEVLDSESALTQARLMNIQAKYKSIISYYSLKRAVGELNPLKEK